MSVEGKWEELTVHFLTGLEVASTHESVCTRNLRQGKSVLTGCV